MAVMAKDKGSDGTEKITVGLEARPGAAPSCARLGVGELRRTLVSRRKCLRAHHTLIHRREGRAQQPEATCEISGN